MQILVLMALCNLYKFTLYVIPCANVERLSIRGTLVFLSVCVCVCVCACLVCQCVLSINFSNHDLMQAILDGPCVKELRRSRLSQRITVEPKKNKQLSDGPEFNIINLRQTPYYDYDYLVILLL